MSTSVKNLLQKHPVKLDEKSVTVTLFIASPTCSVVGKIEESANWAIQ